MAVGDEARGKRGGGSIEGDQKKRAKLVQPQKCATQQHTIASPTSTFLMGCNLIASG